MIIHVDRNNMCCEAIVRRMPNGELLLVCQEDDVTEPAPLNRVYCFHSKDDGLTWTNRHLIVPENGEAVYDTELNVIDGRVYCYLTYHNGSFLNFRHRIVCSEDNGYTFFDIGPVPVEGFTFIRGLLKLKDGTFLLPYQTYDIDKEENDRLANMEPIQKVWNSKCEYAENGTLISRDNGKNWVKGEPCKLDMHVSDTWKWVWSEPTICELSSGKLVMLLRYDKQGYLFKSESTDKGMTWSEPVKTDIPNPSNKPKLINMEDGRIALLNTPESRCGFKYRFPLEIWISDDDLETYSYKKTLVDYPGWISYPDGFIENNTLYLSYEFNRHDCYFLKVEL